MVAKPRNLLLMERCRYGVPTADGFPTFSAVGEWRIGRLIWTPPSAMFTHRGKGHLHRKSLCRGTTKSSRQPGRRTNAGLRSTRIGRRHQSPPATGLGARMTSLLGVLTNPVQP